jgi:hypothetical protein
MAMLRVTAAFSDEVRALKVPWSKPVDSAFGAVKADLR